MADGLCRPDLVYDVGLHLGEDTAYYLFRRFSVVAIEANPELVLLAKHRFRDEIRAGRLTILGVGIAPTPGEAEFFVSRGKSVWSSFDRNRAARGGGCDAVTVPCVPFADILREHGVPWYLKVDIEGSDALCIAGLTPPHLPRCISLEMSHETGGEDIRALAELGYDRFKCVRENDLRVLDAEAVAEIVNKRRFAAALGPPGRALCLPARAWQRLRRPRLGNWIFPRGASGAFGEDLSGRWLSFTEMLAIWQLLHDAGPELVASGAGDWFDVHAAR